MSTDTHSVPKWKNLTDVLTSNIHALRELLAAVQCSPFIQWVYLWTGSHKEPPWLCQEIWIIYNFTLWHWSRKASFFTWLPNPQVDRSTMLLNSISELLNSPNYSTLYTQNTKQNQNEKKVSTYKNLIFWPSAFICLHPLCHHAVDKMLW